MRSIISANPIGASEIKDSDLERMQNIDQEAQDYLRSPAEVALVPTPELLRLA